MLVDSRGNFHSRIPFDVFVTIVLQRSFPRVPLSEVRNRGKNRRVAIKRRRYVMTHAMRSSSQSRPVINFHWPIVHSRFNDVKYYVFWTGYFCTPLMNELKPREARFQKTARSAGFFLAASAAKFWKRDISSASESAFPGIFWRCFWLFNSIQKEVLLYTRIHSLLINGVVTASSHALWRVHSNKVIWVLVISKSVGFGWGIPPAVRCFL